MAAKRPARRKVAAMNESPANPRLTENQILRNLPPAEQERLRPLLSTVELEQGTALYQPGIYADHFVYENIIDANALTGGYDAARTVDNSLLLVATVGAVAIAGRRREAKEVPA